MPAVDSFVGDGLNPSPYKEALARAERAEAERDALRAVLRKVEWLEFRAGSLDGPELYLCAACGQDRVNGHLSRCSVAKALDAARKEGEG